MECPGEDPYLTGQYAAQFVTGFQESSESPGQLLASACCKHFVANEMEHTDQNGIVEDRESFGEFSLDNFFFSKLLKMRLSP